MSGQPPQQPGWGAPPQGSWPQQPPNPQGPWQAPAGPTPPAGYGWNAPPPRKSRAPLVVIIVLVVVVLVIGGLVYLGSQLGGLFGGTSLSALTVGQCFNGARAPAGSSSLVLGVDVVACTAPHTSELIASFDYVGAGSGVPYPGLDSVRAYAQQECRDSFASYIGLGFDQSVFDMTFVYPLQANWTAGDYSIQCVVHPPAGQEQASESFRNARR